MSYVGNSPSRELVLRLEARKSFALSLHIKDDLGRALDIQGAIVRLVIGQAGSDLIRSASIVTPAEGYAKIELQAEDLDFEIGEHPYSVVLVDDGFSTVLVKGTIDLQQNTDYDSVLATYTGANPASSLSIHLRDGATIDIRTGPSMAPGTHSFTDADKQALDDVIAKQRDFSVPDWQAGVGSPGYIKNKPAFTEDGEAIPGVATVNGQTGHVSVTLADLAEDAEHATISQAEKERLAELTPFDSGTLGSAAFQPTTAFRAAGSVPAADIGGTLTNLQIPKLNGLRGFSYGTAAPTGGADGDLYFQYT